MFRKYTLPFVLLLSIIAMVAYQSQRGMECEQLRMYFDPLEQIVIDSQSRDAFEDNIQRAGLFDPDSLEFFDFDRRSRRQSDNGSSVEYVDIDLMIYAHFDDTVLRSISVPVIRNSITLNNILECYGAPERYNALEFTGERPTIVFLFYYPQRGLTVAGIANANRRQTSSSIQLTDLIFTPPQLSIQEMVDRSDQFSSDIGADIEPLARPWPGTVEKLIVD